MPFAIAPDAAFAAVEDGAVVLHMGTKRYYSLNETGAFVWRKLQNGDAPEVIVAELIDQYDVTAAEAAMAVARLLEELTSEQLVVRLASS